MTLTQLQTATAAILGQTVDASFTELFLIAANNVRKNAELRHDFEHCRIEATLDIDGETGGVLDQAVISGDVPRTAVVTGTLSPAGTGTYAQTGYAYGYPLYTRTTAPTFYLFYDGDDWIITNSATTSANSWANIGASNTTPTGSYTAQGTNTGTATVVGSDLSQYNGIRQIVALTTTRADGFRMPLDFTRPDIAIERDRYEDEVSADFAFADRYPSDARLLSQGSLATVVQRGGTLFISPLDTTAADPITVNIEGYAWLNDYTEDTLDETSAPDFIVEHGFQYMQWAIVCEMNYIYQRFVPRQEGVLSAPEEKMKQAWQDLVVWDSYSVDANSTRSR
jgi:hypothetical protein